MDFATLRKSPLPLNAPRKQSPTHLGLVLVSHKRKEDKLAEAVLLECVEKAKSWCREAGILELTVYDNHGVLRECSDNIREQFEAEIFTEDESGESEIEYPLTPPRSESCGSRSHSPEFIGASSLSVVTIPKRDREGRKSIRRRNVVVRRRSSRNDKPADTKNLILHIASRESSKPAIASVARSLVLSWSRRRSKSRLSKMEDTESFELSPEDLNKILEGPAGLPSPSLLIVHHIHPGHQHHRAFELYGFPPWQIALSEIYYTQSCQKVDWLSWLRTLFTYDTSRSIPLSEEAFCRALDEFANAQMRLGK